MSFTIREEVVASLSTCKVHSTLLACLYSSVFGAIKPAKNKAEELCTLVKAHAHHFDRLTFDKAPALKR